MEMHILIVCCFCFFFNLLFQCRHNNSFNVTFTLVMLVQCESKKVDRDCLCFEKQTNNTQEFSQAYLKQTLFPAYYKKE